MDVIFQPTRGNPFIVEVGFFDTVLEIKEKIQKDHGIPASKQTLIFNGNVLQDELDVHYSEIVEQSRINLVVAPEPINIEESSGSKIQIILKMPTSKLGVAVDMDANKTVRKLKEKIQEREGVPINMIAIHANGVELHDQKCLRECELSNSSEIEVSFLRSPPASAISSGSSGNARAYRKLRVVVVSKCGTKKVPMEVNFLDNVGNLRNKLEKVNDQLQLDLPQEGYFFIYKQEVMDDGRSFKWHSVMQGDTIEIFNGSVSGGD